MSARMLFPEPLFGEVNSLAGFVHPLTGKSYFYAGERTALAWACDIAFAIERSGREVVVVVESGASPLAEMVEEILLDAGISKQFLRVKFPREPIHDIYPVLAHYICDPEFEAFLDQSQVDDLNSNPLLGGSRIPQRATRHEALRCICKLLPAGFVETGHADIFSLLHNELSETTRNFRHAVACALAGTLIAEALNQPFVLLDECVETGTSLRNSLTYLSCLSEHVDCMVASHYINLEGAKLHPRVLHTCFAGSERLDCYEQGAYPYENRLDLIGHFYAMTPARLVNQPVEPIASLNGDNADDPGARDTLDQLYQAAKFHLARVRGACELDQVAQFIDEHHLVRYYLWCLEGAHGDPVLTEFAYQIFDMYGPAWAPLPADFHLDFRAAFERSAGLFEKWEGYRRVFLQYARTRKTILSGAAALFAPRRREWRRRYSTLLEGDDQPKMSAGFAGARVPLTTPL